METFLRASEIPYTIRAATTQTAPKGKLPFVRIVKDDGQIKTLADTHFIVKHLRTTSSSLRALDEDLTPAQRATSRAFQAWTEDALYPALTYSAWGHDWPNNYDKTYEQIDELPWLFKPVVLFFFRRAQVASLRTIGVGRHAEEEVEILMREWVEGVAAMVGQEGEERWWHGKTRARSTSSSAPSWSARWASTITRSLSGWSRSKGVWSGTRRGSGRGSSRSTRPWPTVWLSQWLQSCPVLRALTFEPHQVPARVRSQTGRAEVRGRDGREDH